MDIGTLIEIALANSDRDRIEVAALEPAEIGIEAVGALTQIVSELVDNALAFSAPGDRIRLTGLNDRGGYLISISDRGVGIPPVLLGELNKILERSGRVSGPDPNLGIALVARIADRHRIGVRLMPAVPGTSARVTVPARLVTRSSEPVPSEPVPSETVEREDEHRLPARPDPAVFAPSEREDTVDLTIFETHPQPAAGVFAMSEEARREAEQFLERVFGTLRNRPAPAPSTPTRNGSNGSRPARDRPRVAEPTSPETTGATVTTLRVRVPGENFAMIEDDPSTVAAEGAIDIRSALSRFADGRRSAERQRRTQD